MRDLPESVRKSVQEQSKGATIRGLHKEVEDGKTYYEAEMAVNGRGRDVLMDATGAIVEIEDEVGLASLPAAAKTGLEKAAGKGTIVKVESITKNNTIVAYEAKVQTGGKRSEIQVRPDGKRITEDK
ncbi:MAG TPA: hypothetical protein VEU62_02785 [Bryobacterales bacterium]|nr:hypothetical protein [Bryobacterales bacterium]